jgi:hypothetical protein
MAIARAKVPGHVCSLYVPVRTAAPIEGTGRPQIAPFRPLTEASWEGLGGGTAVVPFRAATSAISSWICRTP